MELLRQNEESKIGNIKRTYAKPKLRTIEMETDQVLIVGCKLPAGGQAPANPGLCTSPTFCAEEGS